MILDRSALEPQRAFSAEVGEEARLQPAADNDLVEHLAGAPVVLVVVDQVAVGARHVLQRPAAPHRRRPPPAAAHHGAHVHLVEPHRAHLDCTATRSRTRATTAVHEINLVASSVAADRPTATMDVNATQQKRMAAVRLEPISLDRVSSARLPHKSQKRS
ncbi:hypothetical protein U9M48_033094 [Paspalum notatum var. saurae]|uniref:Uncharacterized protein n=1 Tax=Paspalum notatum var. saurae TaxID=547442 RepID=A0AAQ3U7B2_PASNO